MYYNSQNITDQGIELIIRRGVFENLTREEKRKTNWERTHRINDSGDIERQCSVCKEWKIEKDSFYMHNKSKPEKGYSSECKQCGIKRSRKITIKNPERASKQFFDWKKKNLKRLRKVRKDYNNRNKEKIAKYNAQWQEQNRDKTREYNKRHKKHDVTDTEWENCKNFFDNQCAYCGLPIDEHITYRNGKITYMDMHKEHVDDMGANDLSNCVPACQNCNSTKANKTIEEFLDFGLIEKFNKDKYNKIQLWITHEYKKYIEQKPPYRIIRKQNEGLKTYHWELWIVDNKRDFVDCIAIADKKQGLSPYIKSYFDVIHNSNTK